MSACDIISNASDKLFMFIILNYVRSVFTRVFMDLNHRDICSKCIDCELLYFSGIFQYIYFCVINIRTI